MEGEKRGMQGERGEPVRVEGGDAGHVIEAFGGTRDLLGGEGKEGGEEG